MARRRGRSVTPDDRVYLARACELAARGVGSVAPNPPVGAVFVRDGRTLGEGYHHRRGEPHAEVEAIRAAGGDVRGATLFVSLEPCDHTGLTPPCAATLVAAGVQRVVIGALDPNPRTAGRGVTRLRAAGVDVEVCDDAVARTLIEGFAVWIASTRPYVTLKLAASVDGYVAPRPGAYWLTGDASRDFVRELRIAHDMVMVGAGTVLVDDPQLTVRPPHARRTPYHRACVCDGRAVPGDRRIFAAQDGYAPTTVVAAGRKAAFRQLEGLAEVVYVGEDGADAVDVVQGLIALKERGISSVLCEGGPRLAARCIEAGVVDRLEWLVAPVRLAGDEAVPALPLHLQPGGPAWNVDIVEQLGDDRRISARPSGVR